MTRDFQALPVSMSPRAFLLVPLLWLAGCAPMAPAVVQQNDTAADQITPLPLGQTYSRGARRPPLVTPMAHLFNQIERHTAYKPYHAGCLPLDDPALLQVPWIHLSAANRTSISLQQLTDAELDNLGTYLSMGGFMVMGSSGNQETLRGGMFSILREALGRKRLQEGRDWRFIRLKSDHPIYHSLFDFDPEGFDTGLVVAGQLTALMTTWPLLTDNTTLRSGHLEVDGLRFVQFTANTVIFAASQTPLTD